MGRSARATAVAGAAITAGGHLPWGRRAVLIAHPRHRSLTSFLSEQLEQRGFASAVDEPHTGYVPAPTDRPIVVFGEHRRADEVDALWRTVGTCAEEGCPAILLVGGDRPLELPPHLVSAGIVRSSQAPAHVFSDVLRVLLGDLPPWLRCTTAVDVLRAPTGVTWWDDAIHVADEQLGHVVRIGAGGATTLVPGLDAPHHIHLDREKLLVANRGAHELLLAETTGDSARPLEALRHLDGMRLTHPNAVHQAEGVTALADTDNHRVLVTRSDPIDRPDDAWRAVEPSGELAYPTGVCVDARYVWIADTHNDRVIACTHEGRLVLAFGGHGRRPGTFDHPTGLARWRDLLLVADEQGARLQALRVRESRGALKLVPIPELSRIGQPWIGRPFALSVNLNEQLAVSDRLRRCVWTIELPTLMQLTGTSAR